MSSCHHLFLTHPSHQCTICDVLFHHDMMNVIILKCHIFSHIWSLPYNHVPIVSDKAFSMLNKTKESSRVMNFSINAINKLVTPAKSFTQNKVRTYV